MRQNCWTVKSTQMYPRTSDRFLAASTEGSLGGVIVDLTVRLSLMFKVVPSGERHFTHLREREREKSQISYWWSSLMNCRPHLLFILSGVFFLLASYNHTKMVIIAACSPPGSVCHLLNSLLWAVVCHLHFALEMQLPLHSSHHFLSTWDAVMSINKNFRNYKESGHEASGLGMRLAVWA